ncbi:MAG: ABC transporter ATP-binding protein [Planctomycetota bacterium]|nr:ABC transporter ATP-binding protein [Planctomycetota bacterium]
MILVDQARKTYGARTAVDGVSFELRSGETFGLLGPNGAGKTTTIHLLAGLLDPDGGRIEVAGAADPRRAEVRRKLGLAPQTLSLYEDLTGAENLSFMGRLYGLGGGKLRERVAWALEFSGLAERARDRVKTYSGGMQRRLNLACALIHEPAALLLDEPTVGVDPQSRNRIFENIEALKKMGLTILYTTHYMEEAQRLCDRVAIMDAGRILALDTLSALIDAHGGAAQVTAEFEAPPAGIEALFPGGTLTGRTLRFATAKPLEDAAKLAQAGHAIRALHVDRPDLERVFLSLTGRRLRDE